MDERDIQALLPRPYDPSHPYNPAELGFIIHACDADQMAIHRQRAAMERREQLVVALRQRARDALYGVEGLQELLGLRTQPEAEAQHADVLAENERLVTETIEEQIEEGGQ